jgi:hypothetical protein
MINIINSDKNLTFYNVFIIWDILFYLFYPNIMSKKVKNLKIDIEVHDMLKSYCDKNGLKMYKFVEQLIKEKCAVKKDIYGEN